MRSLRTLGVILLAAVIGTGGTLAVLAVLDLPASAGVTIETRPLATGTALAEEVTTPTDTPTAATAVFPDANQLASSLSTAPEQMDRTLALGRIPVPVLDALGGSGAVKVIAYDTIDGGLDGWTGGVVTFEDGRAVMGKGYAEWSQPLTPPFAVVGRISFTADAFFEIMVQDGVWATPGLRRWGFYGQDDEFTPNVYVGNAEAAPTGAASIAAESGAWYWIVLAINEDAALYGFWLDGSDATAVGVTGPIDWEVSEYSLGIQVFPDGGLLTVDEYYLLAP